VHCQRRSASRGRTLNFSNTRGCHQRIWSGGVLDYIYANRGTRRNRGVVSRLWRRDNHSLPLAMFA